MRHGGCLVFLLYILDDIEGFITVASARAIGAGNEVGLERHQFSDCFFEGLKSLVCFGREELEGIGDRFLFENISNFEHSFTCHPRML